METLLSACAAPVVNPHTIATVRPTVPHGICLLIQVDRPVLVVNLKSVVADNDVVIRSAVDGVDEVQVAGGTRLADESGLGA